MCPGIVGNILRMKDFVHGASLYTHEYFLYTYRVDHISHRCRQNREGHFLKCFVYALCCYIFVHIRRQEGEPWSVESVLSPFPVP